MIPPPRSPILSVARCCVLLVLLAVFAAADLYVFVDATPASPTLNADSVKSPGGVALVAGPNDIAGNGGLWSYRTDVSSFEGGGYFQSSVSKLGSGDPGGGKNNREAAAARIAKSVPPLSASRLKPAGIFGRNDASKANSRTSSSGSAYPGPVTSAVADEHTQLDGIGTRSVAAAPVSVHRDVFLIAGQSNGDGRGLKAELTGPLAGFAGVQPGVRIHYTNLAYANADKSRYRKWVSLEPGYSVAPGYTGALPSTTFGKEIGAAKVLAAHYPNLSFIKVTRGGTALGVPGTDWYPAPLDSPNAGPLYKALIESTRLALAELDAAGDTYTVHALFWHQGESDSGRTAQYGGLLTTLIDSVRRDLSLPNLRFLVGELADTKAQTFRDVQWQVARTAANAGFISSRGLVTGDGTHFTTAAMTVYGGRLGQALAPGRTLVDFEAPAFGAGALDRQDEFAATGGATSALQVVATTAQGEYAGGQAAGHVGASGAYYATRRELLPLASARSLQADFFPGDSGYDNHGDADSSLLVAVWGADAGNDGQFTDVEAAIGFGLNQTGTFRVQIGAQTYLATSFTYQIDRWYRLTLTWSEADAQGRRSVRLFARDLAAGTNLNGGQPVLDITTQAADFNGNPTAWLGLGCRATRGLFDNIRVTAPGFADWAATFYPTLTGGPLADDDRDGILNGIEFAFGLDPLRPDPASILPQPVFGATAAAVSFAPLAAQPGLFHEVDWSRDLTQWQTITGTRSGPLIEFTIPTANEPAIFIRHRVTVTE